LWARKGGWRKLVSYYKINKKISMNQKIRCTGDCYIGNVSYLGFLKIFTNNEGVLIKVNFIFRIGYPSIFIPFSELTQITIKNTPFPEHYINFIKKLYKFTDVIYAQLILRSMPDFILIIPWRKEFLKSIPPTVKIIFKD
jgi:hypothetical protein